MCDVMAFAIDSVVRDTILESTVARNLFQLVSLSQTQSDAQGLIASCVSTHTVRVWAADKAKFALAATLRLVENCVVCTFRCPLKVA